jgi:RNA polymerase sigma-70 factor (ECF subfamily)
LIDDGAASSGAGATSGISTSLLIRLKAADNSAWDRFVALFGPLVYLWCRDGGLQAADASDVGQEVFKAIARKIADFRRDRPGDSFRGWVRTIAHNKIVDFYRSRDGDVRAAGGSDAYRELLAAAAPSDSATGSSVSITEANLQRERELLFKRASELIRSSFEERTWQAFYRTKVEKQTPKDVAADMKMTVNAVYLAGSKIMRRLRDEFGDVVEI